MGDKCICGAVFQECEILEDGRIIYRCSACGREEIEEAKHDPI